MERIRDLLMRAFFSSVPLSDHVLTRYAPLSAENDNLPIHEDKAKGVYVKGLSDYYVGNAAEVYEIMRQGGNSRATSSTSASSPFHIRGQQEITHLFLHTNSHERRIISFPLHFRHQHRPT